MATTTTTNSGKAWAFDVQMFQPADVIPESLLLLTSTVAGVVEGDAPLARVAFAGDADADWVAEGEEIDQDEAPLDEITFPTRKSAVLFRVSRELFQQPNVAEQLAASASRGLTKKSNANYLAQPAPVAPATAPVAGLLNQAGVVDGGEVSGSLDALVDLYAELEVNGARPSHLILDPLGFAALSKLRKGTGSNESLLGAGTETAEARLLSLPVLKDASIPAYSGAVVSQLDVISAVGQIQVAVSDQAFFSSDSIGVRATWRYGFALPRADRLGKFTVTDGA